MSEPSRRPAAHVVDLAAYRAAHPKPRALPALLPARRGTRSLTTRSAAHRALMLRHLERLASGRPSCD